MKKRIIILILLFASIFAFACDKESGKAISENGLQEYEVWVYTDLNNKELEKRVKKDLKGKGGKLSSIETKKLKVETKDFDIRLVSIKYLAREPIERDWWAYIKRERHETTIFSNIESKNYPSEVEEDDSSRLERKKEDGFPRLEKEIEELFEERQTSLISLEKIGKEKYKVVYESPTVWGDFLKEYEKEWIYFNGVKLAKRSAKIESFLDSDELKAEINKDLKKTNGGIVSLKLIENKVSDDGVKTYDLIYASTRNIYEDGQIIGPTFEELPDEGEKKEDLTSNKSTKEFTIEIPTNMSKKEFRKAIENDLEAKNGKLVEIKKKGFHLARTVKNEKIIKKVKMKNFLVKYTAKEEIFKPEIRYLKDIFRDDSGKMEDFNVTITSRTKDEEKLKEQIAAYLKRNNADLIGFKKGKEKNEFDVVYKGTDGGILRGRSEWICKENTRIFKYGCTVFSFLGRDELEKELNKILKPNNGWIEILSTDNSKGYCYPGAPDTDCVIDWITVIKGPDEIKKYELEYRASKYTFLGEELIGPIPEDFKNKLFP